MNELEWNSFLEQTKRVDSASRPAELPVGTAPTVPAQHVPPPATNNVRLAEEKRQPSHRFPLGFQWFRSIDSTDSDGTGFLSESNDDELSE